MLLVFTGIDGAGKTTAARALVSAAPPQRPVLMLGNYSGRRTLTAWCRRLGWQLPETVMDRLETAVRIINVLVSYLRAVRFDGLVVMDRHLYCQLALRNSRGIRRGWLLPWLIRHLPQPDAVLYFDVSIDQAYARITERGTDVETLERLRAYRDGYRELPEYGSFIRVDAGAPTAAVLRQIEQVVEPVPAACADSP